MSIAGKILRVNLNEGQIRQESTLEYVASYWIQKGLFLGGSELALWILLREVRPWTMPFDPGNKLIFSVGTLVGTLAPAASRATVVSKNVFTNGFASSSFGGHFGAELKFAGYDAVVIEGQSTRPVYLWIDDNSIELRDAREYWGKTTWETDNLIKRDTRSARAHVVTIGPAGENLVRSACIIVDAARAAGRCGLGAVMGSKKLKAIAVRGTSPLKVAHPERFLQAVDLALKKFAKSKWVQLVGKYGTHLDDYAIFEGSSVSQISSDYKNFQDDFWPLQERQKLNMHLYHEKYERRSLSCFNCPIHCSHYYSIERGEYAGTECEGFEANDISNFGENFDIAQPDFIIKSHAVCSQYGLDQDNASRVVAWAFECFEKGLLTTEDTDGLALEWGDSSVVLELLRKLTYREGFGDILAEGCKRASEIIGRNSKKYCMHIKGQDLYETMRAAKGWALGVATAARGGGHTSGSSPAGRMAYPKGFCVRMWNAPEGNNPRSYAGKAQIVSYMEKLIAGCDALGICYFATIRDDPSLLTHDDCAELFSAATGIEITGEELLFLGERMRNLEKAFNAFHTEFTRKDDYPPKRFMEEPIKSGPFKGELLERDKWGKMLDEYYELHEWDIETGLQTERCLKRLGLEEVLFDLKKAGRLR